MTEIQIFLSSGNSKSYSSEEPFIFIFFTAFYEFENSFSVVTNVDASDCIAFISSLINICDW